MRELKNADSVWFMGDRGEASSATKGPHPLEHAIAQALKEGYKITGMENVKVFPDDEHQRPYESPAIILFDNDKERHAAIVLTPCNYKVIFMTL